MSHVSTCPLCEASCGILVDIQDGRIRGVRGDDADPLSRGYVCPKAAALADLHDDPDRVRTPLVRDGARWRDVGWDEAIDRAAHGLRRTRRRHGRDAVAVYYGNPVAHNLGLMTHGLPFTRALRTRNVYTASSTDQLPQMLVAFRMFGHLAVIPVPDVDRTDLLVVFGANPLVSNGSLMTAPDMRRRLRDLRRRGGRLVVVDPRRTETAAIADQHVAPHPGTDALLLAAMLHVVFAEGQTRCGRLEGRVSNVERLASFVAAFPPERVAARTGVTPATIRRLATEFAQARRAACYSRVGLCTQRYGTLASWLIQTLNLLTGRIDAVGGTMLPTPAVDAVKVLDRLGLRGTYARWRSSVRRLPEFGGDLPVAALADEIASAGTGRVRALVTMAGNPVLSAPNGRRLDRALATLDHMVSLDPYLNETTRHAHVLLPPAPPLTRPHYDLALYAFAVRNVAKFTAPAIPRAPEERHDWEILAALGGRVLAPRPLRPLAVGAARRLTPERAVDLLLRCGPHRLNLETLRASPHGIDLGPLEPGRVTRAIATADGRVDAAPDDFLREARIRLPGEADRPPTGGLLLVGRRQLASNNSWMHYAARLMQGPHRCRVLMHPDDATSRRLASGDVVRLTSTIGSIDVQVEVTDEMRPGVVSLPHGWGHDREGTRLRVARRHAGVSANDVTDDDYLDTLTGTAAFNGLRVSVEPTGEGGSPGGP